MESPVRYLALEFLSIRDGVQRRREIRITYMDTISRAVKRTNNFDRIRIGNVRRTNNNGDVGVGGGREGGLGYGDDPEDRRR